MTHRRALITGLLASVAAPAMARLAPPVRYSTPEQLLDELRTRIFSAQYRMVRDMFDNMYQPYGPIGWQTYWDGENIRLREVSRDEFYQND